MNSSPLVVMGVSGVGKSTVAELLSQRAGLRYVDADDLHGEANIAKMSAGTPLTDDDRWPWLARVGAELASAPTAVVACSALKRSYRDSLRAQAPDTVFILLAADAAQISTQVSSREGHFMPPTLLQSQLAALEPLEADEQGMVIVVDGPPEVLAERIMSNALSTLASRAFPAA